MQEGIQTQAPGFKNAAEVEEAVEVVEVVGMQPFTPEELARLDQLYGRAFA